ncbi:MAG: histidinol dehydrogenase [Chthoniobacter sp.]|jgi:histidinol dehydrogenase|nr:histidinol dehydrogenase [Chthoniobacter sp.]
MQILRHTDPDFQTALKQLQRRAEPAPEVQDRVREIIAAVRGRGDDAVIDFTQNFGGPKLGANQLRVSAGELRAAGKTIAQTTKSAIALAHENVREFARRSLRKNWSAKNRQGVRVGERFDPFQRVGIYVPGGTAPLVSSAIMTCTLAASAGVPEIVVTTPADKAGNVNPALLYALKFAGATEVYKVGGAQAIAALAFGTPTIKPVLKVFGPGNAYVVEAKRQVFGTVAVDLLPGPSEILIIADSAAKPEWIAADMLAQAEHGHGSVVVLATDSQRLLNDVQREFNAQGVSLSRQVQLEEVSVFLVLVKTLADAVRLANDFAPEHLSIAAKNSSKLAEKIRTSGAIFLGGISPVVGGDFVAGPSHELPTGGAGKSFAGLTVDQFQRRTSIVRFDKKSLRKSLSAIETFSAIEGLDAHGRSAAIRLTAASRAK